MRIGVLDRYLIRAHTGPFLFALSAITGLLFLNAVALRMESLVGKGLPWSVLGQFMLLSLPHTIALSLPMAVLVAVLYAFSELTEHNEITALAAGGIRPGRVLVPLLLMGLLTTGVMLYFNDAVLPEANHRLKNLLVDIGRKSPTFELREGVVNEIKTNEDRDSYFLTAKRIDPKDNTLEDVAIYDRNDPNRERTTYAARGAMAFNANRTDLFLTLYDGQVMELQNDKQGGFQRLYFEKEIIPMRGVGDELERRMGGSERGDREMDFATLRQNARDKEAEEAAVRDESRARALDAVRSALGLPQVNDTLAEWQPSRPARTHGTVTLLARDPLSQGVITSARTRVTRVDSLEEAADRFRTELHKKWAIAFACLVFTLLGPPLALRFPRGGVGMVVAASSTIFAIYWMGLIGGESLADRRVASPVVSMWISDVVFFLIGLTLAMRMGRAGSTVRGGGWEDLWVQFRDGVTGVFRRLRRSRGTDQAWETR
jgi:lipopolysaccharide export system permease protein